jgi:hypothetical protein
MDPNLNVNVPVTTITTTLNRFAKRATTAAEKAYLLELVQGIGDAIATQHPGLKREEFIQASGVSPNWAQQAA